jgi:hypothetical protein
MYVKDEAGQMVREKETDGPEKRRYVCGNRCNADSNPVIADSR